MVNILLKKKNKSRANNILEYDLSESNITEYVFVQYIKELSVKENYGFIKSVKGKIHFDRIPNLTKVKKYLYEPKNTIHGGLGDKYDIPKLAKKYKMRTSQYGKIYDAIDAGIGVEYEHTKDFERAKEIVFDHLVEAGMLYYTELSKMEKRLEDNPQKFEKGGKTPSKTSYKKITSSWRSFVRGSEKSDGEAYIFCHKNGSVLDTKQDPLTKFKLKGLAFIIQETPTGNRCWVSPSKGNELLYQYIASSYNGSNMFSDGGILPNNGKGVVINDIYRQWRAIKDEKQRKKWAEKVSEMPIEKSEIISELESARFPSEDIKTDFISQIEHVFVPVEKEPEKVIVYDNEQQTDMQTKIEKAKIEIEKSLNDSESNEVNEHIEPFADGGNIPVKINWDYDGAIKNYVEFYMPLYSITEKRKTAKIVEMTPDEYIRNISTGFGLSVEESLRYVSDENIDEIAEAMKLGSSFDIPFYHEGKKQQEGRHRALAAKKLGVKTIPVIVFRELSDTEYNNFIKDVRGMSIGEMSEYLKMNFGINEPIDQSEYDKFKHISKYIEFADGGSIEGCDYGTEVQSVIISKDHFSKDEAIDWIKKHKYESGIDETENYYRFRQQEPDEFEKDSFRTIEFTDGIKAIIGCPLNDKMASGGVVRYDRSGNPIGNGNWNIEPTVFDFPEYPQIKSSVSHSQSTESSYVTYENTENNRRITVRFSNHENNAVKFGDQLNGYLTFKDEVLYHLGLRERTFIPHTQLYITSRMVAKKELGNYEEADITIQEMYALGANADISMYEGKIAKGSNYLILGDKVEEFVKTGKNVFGQEVDRGHYIYSEIDKKETKAEKGMETNLGNNDKMGLGDLVYSGKAEYAAKKMYENSKIQTLTEDQHEAVANLCKVRHDIHSNKDKLVKSDESGLKNELLKANDKIRESGLEPMNFIGFYTDGDFIDIDTISEAREFENVNTDDSNYKEWYDDNYFRISAELELLNTEIESYLSEIDKKYSTSYCPTGKSRIFEDGGDICDIDQMENGDMIDMGKGDALTNGSLHIDNGIPAVVKETGQQIEVEQGEIIINRVDAQKHCEELSEINSEHGKKIDCQMLIENSAENNKRDEKMEGEIDNKTGLVKLEKGDSINKNMEKTLNSQSNIVQDEIEKQQVELEEMEVATLFAKGGDVGEKYYIDNRGDGVFQEVKHVRSFDLHGHNWFVYKSDSGKYFGVAEDRTGAVVLRDRSTAKEAEDDAIAAINENQERTDALLAERKLSPKYDENAKMFDDERLEYVSGLIENRNFKQLYDLISFRDNTVSRDAYSKLSGFKINSATTGIQIKQSFKDIYGYDLDAELEKTKKEKEAMAKSEAERVSNQRMQTLKEKYPFINFDGIKAMELARLESVLQKQWRFGDDGIMSRSEWLKKHWPEFTRLEENESLYTREGEKRAKPLMTYRIYRDDTQRGGEYFNEIEKLIFDRFIIRNSESVEPKPFGEYEFGMMYKDDFPTEDLYRTAIMADVNWGVDTLTKLFNSFEDNNYHSDSSPLWDAITALKNNDTETAKVMLGEFKKLCQQWLDAEYNESVTEPIGTFAGQVEPELMRERYKENIPIEVVKSSEYQEAYRNYEKGKMSLDEFNYFVKEKLLNKTKNSKDAEWEKILLAIIPESQKAIFSMTDDYKVNRDRLISQLKAMPKLYEQDGKKGDAIAYLHYYVGSMDVYVTEFTNNDNDSDESSPYEFYTYGSAVADGEFEYAYAYFPEWFNFAPKNIEFDLYFEPTPLREIEDSRNMYWEEKSDITPKEESELEKIRNSSYANAYEQNKAIERFIDLVKDSGVRLSGEDIEFLQRYTGYGGLGKFMDDENISRTDAVGTLYEYYTPDALCKKLWGLAYKHGYNSDLMVLEPSCGIGRIIKYAPKKSLVKAYETNPYSHFIAKETYRDSDIINDYFESEFYMGFGKRSLNKGYEPSFGLVIGNYPFGDYSGKYAGMGEKDYSKASQVDHHFILRGLDALVSGGLMVCIVNSRFMQGGHEEIKKKIEERGELIDAYRLPAGVFQNTEVIADILVIRKR